MAGKQTRKKKRGVIRKAGHMMPDFLCSLLNDCAGRFSFGSGVGWRDGNNNSRQQHGGLNHADCDDAHHSCLRYFDEESPGVNFPII